MNKKSLNLEQAARQTWDAVVIGTGMGGASVGFKLAQSGQKVLFCDTGLINRNQQSLTGKYAESFFEELKTEKQEDILKRASRFIEKIKDSKLASGKFIPFLGSGGGGSTALYGMAMERFFPHDFESWPISYKDLVPYYEKVEKQFEVKGTADPFMNHVASSATLSPSHSFSFSKPPALSKSNQELFQHFQNQGLKPYQLPMACDYVKDCLECSGFLCPLEKNCKNDAFKIYLKPALELENVSYLENCLIEKLEADERSVTGAYARMTDAPAHTLNQQVLLKSKVFILAAGALETPNLLFKSRSSNWPEGLANRSGLVGQFLMRHLIDLYVVDLKSKIEPSALTKQIAFSDLMFQDEKKRMGVLQSFGKIAPPESIFADLIDSTPGWVKPFFKFSQPFFLFIFKILFSNKMILATLSEDKPRIKNCVQLNQNQELEIQYQVDSQDQERQIQLRSKIKKILSPYSFRLLKQAENNKRIAHACGTCRFGTDPEKSVLNAKNQAHGLDNLYIVDSSFFPTAGTKNPSLTIAANGLRVADLILKNF